MGDEGEGAHAATMVMYIKRRDDRGVGGALEQRQGDPAEPQAHDGDGRGSASARVMMVQRGEEEMGDQNRPADRIDRDPPEPGVGDGQAIGAHICSASRAGMSRRSSAHRAGRAPAPRPQPDEEGERSCREEHRRADIGQFRLEEAAGVIGGGVELT